MTPIKDTNVFLFVPNLIGYIRILLLGSSFYFILKDYRLALCLYGFSYTLDAFDGLAARLLNQSSLFGSVLDMLTDRVSTMCLLMTIGHLYSEYFFVFQILLAIDIVSHWLHFFSANLQGKQSHKSSFDRETNYLMRLYYEKKIILTSVCAMEQLFYCSLLVIYHEKNNYHYYQSLYLLAVVCLPAIIFKNWINLLQIFGACSVMAKQQHQQTAPPEISASRQAQKRE